MIIIYGFGIILNLFEEIEFFKNINVSIITPLILTSIFVPSMIINLLPFIIFISSMWFMVKIRNNKDLLILKVYGYSNVKIFFILAITSFLIGWIILIFINPITSSMVKYYENTKSKYARDIDHLVTFNKNGLWIKENHNDNDRIITASKPDGTNLTDIIIFQFDNQFVLQKKIFAKNADITNNDWVMSDVIVFEKKDNLFKKKKINNYKFYSNYNYEKIINLFNNSNTMSFVDLAFNYQRLLNDGYNKQFLNKSLHSLLVLPFFLFLMTALAAILTLHSLKKSENITFVILSLVICVLIYYLKDLSIALGTTDRMPLTLSIWVPIITLSIFTIVGLLQINEK
jgi:lipopolysaccharide export system permease protein